MKKILKFLKILIRFFTSKLWDVISKVFDRHKEHIFEYLLDYAINAVAEMSYKSLINVEKRNTAYNRIKTYAQLKNINISESEINLLVELAVNYLKKKEKRK